MTTIQEDLLNDTVEPPKLASIGSRIAAALLDFVILAALVFALAVLFGKRYEETTKTITHTTSSDDHRTTSESSETNTSVGYKLEGWPAFAQLVIWFFLIPFMEGKFGQTIGKKVLKIKVTRDSNEPTNIGASLLRHLFDFIDCFLLIGLIIAAVNPQRKRIGDLVAGTVVVEEG